MVSPDIHSMQRAKGFRAGGACLLLLVALWAGLLTVRNAAAGTYFMYRDKPLSLMHPRKFALSPQRIRPFDYRREYTPRLVFQWGQFTKSLPPLDPRVKSTLTFPVDFEGFLLECESSIRAVMIRNGEIGDYRFEAPESSAPRMESPGGRAPDSGEGAATTTDPLHGAEFRGPVHLAAAGGEMQTAPEDMTSMIAGLARAVSRNTPIAVQVDSLVALDSPGLRTVPFLLLSFAHEPRLSASEKNHLRQYLRGGGFALVYCDPPSDPEMLLSRLLPDSRPGEAQVKPVPREHPLYHSVFELTDVAEYENAPSGLWIKERLAAVCLARKTGFWVERTPEDPELKLWVNLVVFALSQPGGIAAGMR